MGKRLKNTLLTGVTIGEASNDGKCITRWDGKVVFVEGAAPGDIADIRIIRKKKNYLEAMTERILEPSSLRQDPFCEHFGTCGGCKWQHIKYDSQLEFKRKQVVDSLERIGKMDVNQVHPTLPSPDIQYYRNKLEFTFSNYRWLTHREIQTGLQIDRKGVGFHKPRQFDKVVDVEHCFLQPSPSNEIRNHVRVYAKKNALDFFDIKKKHGFLRNLIVRTTSVGETMVILQVGRNDSELLPLLQNITETFPQVTSLYYVINPKGNETFFDLEVALFSGKEFINEKMGNLEFSIGPKSFYQTNSHQAHRMYSLIKDLCGFDGT